MMNFFKQASTRFNNNVHILATSLPIRMLRYSAPRHRYSTSQIPETNGNKWSAWWCKTATTYLL